MIIFVLILTTFKWELYLFIANFFATQIIGGAKDLVVLLWLSGNIYYKQWTKRVVSPLHVIFRGSSEIGSSLKLNPHKQI